MARACQDRNLRDAEGWSSVEVEEESTLIPAAAADWRCQGRTSDPASSMILDTPSFSSITNMLHSSYQALSSKKCDALNAVIQESDANATQQLLQGAH